VEVGTEEEPVGKIIATYMAKITLRESDSKPSARIPPPPPTIAEIEALIVDAVGTDIVDVNVTAERTDR
jgi:hypothetical protein